MTINHIEAAAKRMAEGMNGGAWETHYTEGQRDIWRKRVCDMWGVKTYRLTCSHATTC